MQRFDEWELTRVPDFWKTKFQPKDILRILSFATSVVAQREDARILERYDINKLDEHTPGVCYIWVPITLDEPTYLGEDNLYPYVYDVDPGWLYIDAIYDSHVNPSINLQSQIDFTYKEKSGKLYATKRISNPDGTIPKRLYISKGWYAEYRIYNEIGHFLNYVDTDSSWYRDSIAPILAALYVGPTYTNILAMLNVMIGLPVAKYDGEVVQSITPTTIITDKYVYDIKRVHTNLKVGDTLFRFQPLTDAVELHAAEQEPEWWKRQPCDIFSRYASGTDMTELVRDFLMNSFLRDSVAAAEFRQDKLGSNQLILSKPILNIFNDALPTKTDMFMAQTYHVGTSRDPDGRVMDPYTLIDKPLYNDDGSRKGHWEKEWNEETQSYTYTKFVYDNLPLLGGRLRIKSSYGYFGGHDLGENGQFGIDVNYIGWGKIYNHLPKPDDPDYTEEKYLLWLSGRDKRKRFSIGNGLWHLRSNNLDPYHEFWRTESPYRPEGTLVYGYYFDGEFYKDQYKIELLPHSSELTYVNLGVIPNTWYKWTGKKYERSYRSEIDYLSNYWKQEPLLEPWSDTVYIRMIDTEGKALWKGPQIKHIPKGVTVITDEAHNPKTLGTGFGGPGGFNNGYSNVATIGNISEIRNPSTGEETSIQKIEIPANTIYGVTQLANWELTNIERIAGGFRVGKASNTGYIQGPQNGINIGRIEKKIWPIVKGSIPDTNGVGVYLQYRVMTESGPGPWEYINNNQIIADIDGNPVWLTGKLQFRIELVKNPMANNGNPTVYSLQIKIIV